jgi:hypothetical protein
MIPFPRLEKIQRNVTGNKKGKKQYDKIYPCKDNFLEKNFPQRLPVKPFHSGRKINRDQDQHPCNMIAVLTDYLAQYDHQ